MRRRGKVSAKTQALSIWLPFRVAAHGSPSLIHTRTHAHTHQISSSLLCTLPFLRRVVMRITVLTHSIHTVQHWCAPLPIYAGRPGAMMD